MKSGRTSTPRQPDRSGPGIYPLETHAFSCLKGTPHVQKRAHWHNDVELNLLTSGAVTYLWHGRLERISAPSLALFWAGLPHQVIQVDENPECYWIYVPLASFLTWRLPPFFTNAALSGRMFTEPLRGKDPIVLSLMRRWHSDMSYDDPDLREIVLLEIQAYVRRIAHGAPAQKLEPIRLVRERVAGPVQRLEAMVNFMALHFREPLTLQQIADAGGLHRNYACAFFKRACGMSANEYLTEIRISQAKRLLMTSAESVIQIAFEAGFGSASRFYEAFKTSCGISPAAYRRLARASMAE